ncbi:MAG: PilZ domain-containing protein [Deltaproteobacteria bacterium]|nr:PilZ domain-containing protein [Deltaproteobacteria bacterium]MBW2070708.1 PilZ domain-containing protein [Deltaproteobacteria bacterium]
MLVRQLLRKPMERLTVLRGAPAVPEARKHPRAKIKLPVVMMVGESLIDGWTQNLSCGGAFIRCHQAPDSENGFRIVITAKERLILLNARVVWSAVSSEESGEQIRGIGVSFSTVCGHDRIFLNNLIVDHA